MIDFDAIIIGAGQAGPPLAARLSAAGMNIALVERKYFGGTCVNTGCVPTKTMIASAYAARMAQRAQEYGVVLKSPVTVDMMAVKARKDAISLRLRKGVEASLQGLKNCTLFRGQARFESSTEVRVGDDLLSSRRIFLNVGGRASVPDMPGVNEVPYLNNSSVLDLDVVPRHLIIVGGSYIGLEFAQMFRRFGGEVTVVEMKSRLVAHEDPDISDAIAGIMRNEGIELRLNAECISLKKHQQGVAVTTHCKEGEPEVRGSHVLLAVGRRPNTDDLGLDKAGVNQDKHGYIVVDDQLRTNVPGIWALGDCNGQGGFTHTAYNDFEIVAANLLDNDPRRLSDRIKAYALFIDPPLGRAGLTETQVRESGRRALVGQRPMAQVGRAVEKVETQGLMKIVVDAESKKILGAAVLGTGGDEAIHCVLDVMYAQAPYTVMQRAVHIHPTVSELLPTILGNLQPLAQPDATASEPAKKIAS